MKSIYKTLIYSLLIPTLGACSEDPLTSEQYKNEVYLVGAYNKAWAIDVKYVEDTYEDYFAVSSSGSLDINQDAHISAAIDNSLIDTYNRKFLGFGNEEQYFHALDESLYEIPSLENIVIEHKKDISAKVPVFIKTKTLDPDTRYAIPVRITSSTPYEVNASGEKMLIELKLHNEYSGNYQDEGTRIAPAGTISDIQRPKVLSATGINKLRYFYGINNESNKMADKRAKTIEITILDEFVEGSTTLKKVTVTGWGDVILTDQGDGTYDTVHRVFNIAYTTNDGFIFQEKLTAEEEKKS